MNTEIIVENAVLYIASKNDRVHYLKNSFQVLAPPQVIHFKILFYVHFNIVEDLKISSDLQPIHDWGI